MAKVAYPVEGGGGRADASSYQYNPQTGKWEPVASSNNSTNPGTTSGGTTNANGGTVTVDTNSKVDSKGAADKDYIEIEFHTLVGELVVTASTKSLPLRAGQTIRLNGLGNYLSGLYFISAVKRTIDGSSGYTQTLTVIKTGFGKSLKNVTVTTQPLEVVEPRPDPVPAPEPTAFKVGDKVKFKSVGSHLYTYTNAHAGVWVPQWVTAMSFHTVDGVSSDGLRVRLKEIWSWVKVADLTRV